MKQLFLSLILCAALIATLLGIKQFNHQSARPGITIGILQTASHPALDLVRTHAIATLQQTFGPTTTFVVRNGQGQIAQLHAAADSMVADHRIKAFITIGTPATQALAQREHHRPIIFSAVTVLPGQTPAWLGPNVFGASDDVDAIPQMDLVQSIVQGHATIGLLFNPAEPNSCIAIEHLEQECARRNLTSVRIGIMREIDIAPALAKHLPLCDMLVAPTDNTVASAIKLIVREVQKTPRPLVVSDHTLIQDGIAASCGTDYATNGTEAAQILVRILTRQQRPEDPRVTHQKSSVQLNQTTLTQLGILVEPPHVLTSPRAIRSNHA